MADLVAQLLNPGNEEATLILEGICPSCRLALIDEYTTEPFGASLDFECDGEAITQRLIYCAGCERWYGGRVKDGRPHGYTWMDDTVMERGYDFTPPNTVWAAFLNGRAAARLAVNEPKERP